MEQYYFNDIQFILLNTHYTHRIIDNYDYYKSQIERLGRRISLYGVYTCPHSYGYNDHPLIYPTDNLSVMEDIKEEMMMEREDIVGSILVKNGGNELINRYVLNEIVDSMNDFCGFFNMDSVISHRIVGVRVGDEFLRVLYMDFDTESG